MKLLKNVFLLILLLGSTSVFAQPAEVPLPVDAFVDASQAVIEMQALIPGQAPPTMPPRGICGCSAFRIPWGAMNYMKFTIGVLGGGGLIAGIIYTTVRTDGSSDGPPPPAAWMGEPGTTNLSSRSTPVGVNTATPNPNYKLDVAGSAHLDPVNAPEIKFGSSFVLQKDGQSISLLNLSADQAAINSNSFATGANLTVKGKALFYDGTLPTTQFSYNMAAAKGVLTKDLAFVATTAWPDFVFSTDYDLMKLSDLETFIRKYGHLPSFPSEKKIMSQGEFSLNEQMISLLKQVEELTLYKIETNKKLQEARQNLSAISKK